jgi:hypothetical protein
MSTLSTATAGYENTLQQLAARQTLLTNQVEILDALYRFAAGQDLRDKELFRSAWTTDAVLDFVQPAARLGVQLPPFTGGDAITDAIMGSLSGLDTTHTVTNPRIEVQEGTAQLMALVEAQHLPRQDHSRNLLLKNIYHCEVVLEQGEWRIRRMRIENVWMRGDPKVLFPS